MNATVDSTSAISTGSILISIAFAVGLGLTVVLVIRRIYLWSIRKRAEAMCRVIERYINERR